MIIGRKLWQIALATVFVAAFAGFQAKPASAQLFWDWGGGSETNGSGREVIQFSPKYAKGQIIVSFSDRRLYYITQPGQAISYPIAAPREQSRWQGVTSVSQKRENPSWTPTPTMIAIIAPHPITFVSFFIVCNLHRYRSAPEGLKSSLIDCSRITVEAPCPMKSFALDFPL